MENDKLEYELMKVLYRRERIQLLAGRIEQLTGYPVFFLTVNCELMAKSPLVHEKDIVIKKDILRLRKNETYSYSEYSAIKASATELISQSPYRTQIWGRNYLFANSYLYSNHMGSVAFPEYKKPVSELDPATLEIILRVFALCQAATLGQENHLKENNWEGILKKLLDGTIRNVTALEHEIKNNGTMTTPGQFRLFVFWSRGINLRLLPAYEQLVEQFNSLQRFRCFIEYEESVVLLLNDSQPAQNVPDILGSRLSVDFLEQNNIMVGYSEQSSNLLDIPLLYHEARIAINFSNRWDAAHHITGYEQCKLYDMLYSVNSASGSLKLFITDRFQLIRKFDREHNTQYMNILRELVENRFNLTAAASALFMHKSTLSYHMKKMSEHFAIDFDDRTQILHIEMSFYIMQFFINE